MSTKGFIARNLAAPFLAGHRSLDDLIERGTLAWGEPEKWMRSLARQVLAVLADLPGGMELETLSRFIETCEEFRRGCRDCLRRQHLPVGRIFWVSPAMAAAAGAPASWQVPGLTTSGALAKWLGLTPKELDWFADCHGREGQAPPGPLRHYTYRWLAQRSNKFRLLEMPKQRLKAIQRRLLHEILDQVPAHEAVHGYQRGRSLATYVAPHAGRRIVLRFDLRNFFPSIRSSRVHALFRTTGYPSGVARILTGLCTNVVPPSVLDAHPAGAADAIYRSPHLPQGAPTSPALANLCAFRLDCRLAGLARKLGANYTRYADDLAFSGGAELERSAKRFQVLVCRIALEEGFEVNTRKSRFMRPGVRQQLAGVVLNVHPNICRAEYDRLKAILTNCIRHGPGSQNRAGHADFRAHLLGRVSYVVMVNPARGRRLQTLFQQIGWDMAE